AHTVHGLTMIRARTGYHRLDSGRITWPLPSGAWAVRIYVWAPLLRPSVDILERRHLLVIGDWAIVLRESTGRNALLRLQNNNDLAVTDLQGTESGTAVPIDQLERVEVTYDGAGTLTGRIYAGDSTSGFRQNQWSQAISATSATFSGYRWFRYSVLGPGSPAPDVTAWQNQLIAWNPNALPTYGADGDYGGETITWTQNFQNAYGISPADGIAGPETRSCMELVLARQSDPGYVPPPLWLGEVAIADTAEWIGPAAPPGGPATGPITITASPHGQKRGAATAQVQPVPRTGPGPPRPTCSRRRPRPSGPSTARGLRRRARWRERRRTGWRCCPARRWRWCARPVLLLGANGSLGPPRPTCSRRRPRPSGPSTARGPRPRRR